MMADTTPVMVWRTGPDKRRDFVSKPWLVFGGRTLEEERGTGWIEGVHPEDRGYCTCACSELCRKGCRMR